MEQLLADGYCKTTENLSGKQRMDFWRESICDEFVNLDCDFLSDNTFTGILNGGVSIGNLQFSEVAADPHFVKRSKRQIMQATEEDFLISFQMSQRCLVRQNGREALLTPGTFAMYDSTQPYSITFNERFHKLIVQMPKTVLSRHLMNPEKYTAITINGSCGLGAVLNNFLFSLVRELHRVDEVPQQMSENLVNMIAMAFSSSLMLEQVGESSVTKEALKNRIRQHIDNNLCNPELSNQHVADAQGISVRYLHKLFQEDDISIHGLIMNKRLEKCRELLNNKAYAGHSIEAIAYSIGFASAAHFSRAFKKHFGVNPSEVRNT